MGTTGGYNWMDYLWDGFEAAWAHNMNITCHRKKRRRKSGQLQNLNPKPPDIQLYRQRDCYVASSLSSTNHDATVIFNLLATSSCTSPSTFSLKAAISPSVIIAVSVRVGSILPACSTSVAGTTLSSVTITIFTPKLALEKTNPPIGIKILILRCWLLTCPHAGKHISLKASSIHWAQVS